MSSVPKRFALHSCAVLAGTGTDAGKTVAVTDCLLGTRVPNLIRFEIEDRSTGSAKIAPEQRIPATDLSKLRRALLDLEDDQNLVCDVGGTEYVSFMNEIAKARSTAKRIDRFIFVMRAVGIKQGDALNSIAELVDMGAEPRKISVIFNFAPFTQGLDRLRANLRKDFEKVFEASEQVGFHICPTPIMRADALYRAVANSKKWTIDGLASAPDFGLQLAELRRAGTVPDSFYEMELVQDNARSFGKPNLDAVWRELLAAAEAEAAAESDVA